MSLRLQLQALWSSSKFLAVGAIILTIVAQTLYEKRKREVWRRVRDEGVQEGCYVRLSPSLISEVYRNAEVHCIRIAMSINCFNIPAGLMKSDIPSKILHPAQHKPLPPTGIVPIMKSRTQAVWDLLKEEGSKLEGISTPLHDFIQPVLYQASAYALFGRSCPVVESFEPFHDFLLAGVPRFFLGKHIERLATMQKLLEKYFDSPHEDASCLVLENEQVVRNHGYGSNTVAAFFVSFLFALTANAPNVGYWLIVLNLQREDGLQPLVDEIDEAVASWRHRNSDQEIEDHLCEFILAAELPLLMSTTQETLRYAASVMSIRRVTEPVEFGGHRSDTDDESFCMTRSVHLDEEFHKNALEYNPRRYINQERCEARHPANKEIKTFVVSLLMQYTLEIDPDSAECPTLKSERMGAGVMDPRGDLDLRVILRARRSHDNHVIRFPDMPGKTKPCQERWDTSPRRH